MELRKSRTVGEKPEESEEPRKLITWLAILTREALAKFTSFLRSQNMQSPTTQ